MLREEIKLQLNGALKTLQELEESNNGGTDE